MSNTIARIKQVLHRGVDSLRLRKGYISVSHYDMSESGEVEDGDAGVLFQHPLQDGLEMIVTHAHFSLANGSPAPNNLDLVFIIFDEVGGASLEEIILEGDGSFFIGPEAGDNPDQELLRYENTSGSTERVGIAVDNGEFNAGTGATQDAYASCIAHEERPLTRVG